jgi:hypothetical protein
MARKVRSRKAPNSEPPKRWYERWTTYVAGLTALGLAVIALITTGQQLTDKVREVLYGAGLGTSPYEKAVKDATAMLDTFPMPLVATPVCSQLAGQGQRLRGLVAAIGDIRAVELRADQTSDPQERALALGALAKTYQVRDDVAKWHELVVKEGCIKKS